MIKWPLNIYSDDDKEPDSPALPRPKKVPPWEDEKAVTKWVHLWLDYRGSYDIGDDIPDQFSARWEFGPDASGRIVIRSKPEPKRKVRGRPPLGRERRMSRPIHKAYYDLLFIRALLHEHYRPEQKITPINARALDIAAKRHKVVASTLEVHRRRWSKDRRRA